MISDECYTRPNTTIHFALESFRIPFDGRVDNVTQFIRTILCTYLVGFQHYNFIGAQYANRMNLTSYNDHGYSNCWFRTKWNTIRNEILNCFFFIVCYMLVSECVCSFCIAIWLQGKGKQTDVGWYEYKFHYKMGSYKELHGTHLKIISLQPEFIVCECI